MNRHNIARHLNKKMNDWISHIKDEQIADIIKENAIVTGGALVSLLIGEEPHDYDIYFKTHESCLAVARYYAGRWNESPRTERDVTVEDNDGRITCFIAEKEAVAEEREEIREPDTEKKKRKKAYTPKYFTTNAISLSDKIQLVVRFYGPVNEIHKNYDFVHCTCSYDYSTNTVTLPPDALEAIINRELIYIGSKYPLCSIVRTRKFLSRGYHINAGQYLKMAYQLNELDLNDFEVLKDQLVGVDSLYFSAFIGDMQKMREDNPDAEIDSGYFMQAVDRIFNGGLDHE